MDSNITIFDYCHEEAFVGLKEIIKRDFNVRDKIKEIEAYLKSSIDNCLENHIRTEKIEKISEGSTSICYRNLEGVRYIYKEFYPINLETKLKQLFLEGSQNFSFYWLDEEASDDDYEQFLVRFKRFIEQKEIIDLIIAKANEDKEDSLIEPELYFTSKGLVWGIKNFWGNNLDNEFKETPYIEKQTEKDKQDWLLKRLELILRMAECMNIFFGNEIYHGDIKPENFYKINFDKKATYVIRNIDFDTCAKKEQVAEMCNKGGSISTTELFYDTKRLSDLKSSKNDELFRCMIQLDITALSKVLMLSIASNYVEFYKSLPRESRKFNWEFFFKSGNGGSYLSETLGARNELTGLYIFEQLQCLISNCEDYCNKNISIKTIYVFIERLENIINLIKYNYNLGTYTVTPEVIKCAGLKILDSNSQREGVTYGVNDTVKQVLKNYFV